MSLDPKFIAIIRQELKLPDAQLSAEMTARDLPGWDSMKHLQIIIRLEREYRVKLTTKDILSVRNLGDLALALARAGAP